MYTNQNPVKFIKISAPDGVNYHRKCKTPFMSRSRDQEQGQEACPGVPEVQDTETWDRQRYPERDQSEAVMRQKLTNQRPQKGRQWMRREKEARRVGKFYGSFHKRASLCPTRPRVELPTPVFYKMSELCFYDSSPPAIKPNSISSISSGALNSTQK